MVDKTPASAPPPVTNSSGRNFDPLPESDPFDTLQPIELAVENGPVPMVGTKKGAFFYTTTDRSNWQCGSWPYSGYLGDSQFNGCGDKCVSVGEGSQARMHYIVVEHCLLGIAVKDRSVAWLTESTFQGCDKALNVYRKKWRWGDGGVLYGANNLVVQSRETDIEGDIHSRLVLERTANWTVAGAVDVTLVEKEAWPEWTRE